jgi:hypothetical protein
MAYCRFIYSTTNYSFGTACGPILPSPCPKPPCQLSLWEKPEYLEKTHDFWQSVDIIFSHEKWVQDALWDALLRIKPGTLEVKDKSFNHFATSRYIVNVFPRQTSRLLTHFIPSFHKYNCCAFELDKKQGTMGHISVKWVKKRHGLIVLLTH